MKSKAANSVVCISAMPAGTGMYVPYWDAAMSTGPKAVVLEVFGNGSVPTELLPRITETTRRGIPVFLISKMFGGSRPPEEIFGIYKVTYQTNQSLIDAGAVPLETGNEMHIRRFADFLVEKEAGRAQGEYPGNPRDNILETIGEIVEGEGTMLEKIDKARKVYALTDAEIDSFVERTHKMESRDVRPGIAELVGRQGAEPVDWSVDYVSARVTREDVLNSRRIVDEMLVRLAQEMQDGPRRELGGFH